MADTTTTWPAFLEAYPWMRDALTDAESTRAASWDDGDEGDVLEAIEELCWWLGPYLPRPERVALVARDLAGQDTSFLTRAETYSDPAALLDAIRLLITYLAMVGAGLELLTQPTT